ncbi:hypothetical protein QYF36_012746 [Acer negundo]|nr:hypothetical protein QYF36_012746 [Acer negundo]
MELRQQYTTSQSFETGHNHPRSGITAEWSCMLMGAGALNDFTGRTVAPENGYSVYPRENMHMRGRYYASERDMEIRPFEHAASFIFDGSTVHNNLSNPSYNSFPYFPPCGRFYPTPENSTALSSFGYPNWHTVHEVERGLHNHAMDTGRGRLKRKRLGNSLAYERGSTNRHCNAGSSSNSLEFWRDKPTFGYQNYPSSSIGLPHYRGSSLSIDNEDPSRNVRRRQYGLDWEVNPSRDVRRHCRLDWEVSRRRTYSTNNLSHYYGSTAQNRSRPVEVAWLNADATTHDQNRVATFSAAHTWVQISGSSGLRPEINQYSARGSAADFNGHIHDSISNRNSIFPPSHIHGRHGLAGLEGCYRYSQRTIPPYRTGLSTAHSEQAAPSDNSLQFHSESYSSRYSLSVGGWHSTHQDPRSRTAVERFESLSNAVNAHDQMDQMTVNLSHFYVSRDLFDQYRDMRLDIDNMSYEELLSLGERIGNVRTGLSNNVISKCLVKTTYSTLDDKKKEGPCVICQEDYSDIDEVASIKNCCHDYHTGCIMKWLLIKNACPICQGPALANSPKKN